MYSNAGKYKRRASINCSENSVIRAFARYREIARNAALSSPFPSPSPSPRATPRFAGGGRADVLIPARDDDALLRNYASMEE